MIFMPQFSLPKEAEHMKSIFKNMTFQQEAYFYVSGQVHSWELSEDIDGYIFFCSQDFYEMHYVNQKLKKFSIFRIS
jgi:hypothetical protein